MYEFWFKNADTNEDVILFGYSIDDLYRRYPNVDFTQLNYKDCEYVD